MKSALPYKLNSNWRRRLSALHATLSMFATELRGRGIHTHRLDRLLLFLQSVVDSRTEDPHPDTMRFLRAVSEGLELEDIFQSFRAELPELSTRLDKILRGPDDCVEESPRSNSARNTSFELSFAAALRKAGLPAMPTPGEGGPDIILQLPPDVWKGILEIQCKRPMTRQSVGTNLRSARVQIRQAGEHVCHAVAVWLTRVFLSEKPTGLLDGPEINSISDFVNNFVKGIEREKAVQAQLVKLMAVPSLVGIFFEVVIPTRKSTSGITFLRHITNCPVGPMGQRVIRNFVGRAIDRVRES